MLLSPKRPDTTEQFSWNCKATIQSAAGGTIQEVLEIFEEVPEDGAESVLPVGDAGVDETRFIISSLLAGGMAGRVHKVSARFRTTAGEVLVHTIEFDCRAFVL